jgi:hypothetical protein
MIMTISMEIWGLAGIARNRIEGIVLTGSVGAMEEPFNFFEALKNELRCISSVVKLSPISGSLGSAQIAKAIFEGEREILGIRVDL